MNWQTQQDEENLAGVPQSALFAVHGDLDGEKQSEFQEREQFIGLVVGKEEFLLPIAVVSEIIMLTPITYVPNAPEFVDGVINLRGKIIPAVNLRKMMALPRAEPTSASRIIIAKHEDITFGVLVDGITYVVALLPTEIEHQSLPGKSSGTDCIGGVAKHGQKIQGIIDHVRVLRSAAGAALDEESEEDLEEDAA
jgi:purine-binding chemotaxis protein CheW